jgi:thiol-disulfide isomerase/thioredoxin
MVDLDNIRSRTQTAAEYSSSFKEEYKSDMLERIRTQKLDSAVVEELRTYSDDLVIVYIGDNWCGDCQVAIPVFKKLEEEIGLEVRVFRTVKVAWEDPDNQWAIPPSPPEIGEWKATRIPWIEIFTKKGKRIGTIIEKPVVKPTLEAELLHVIKESMK